MAFVPTYKHLFFLILGYCTVQIVTISNQSVPTSVWGLLRNTKDPVILMGNTTLLNVAFAHAPRRICVPKRESLLLEPTYVLMQIVDMDLLVI